MNGMIATTLIVNLMLITIVILVILDSMELIAESSVDLAGLEKKNKDFYAMIILVVPRRHLYTY